MNEAIIGNYKIDISSVFYDAEAAGLTATVNGKTFYQQFAIVFDGDDKDDIDCYTLTDEHGGNIQCQNSNDADGDKFIFIDPDDDITFEDILAAVIEIYGGRQKIKRAEFISNASMRGIINLAGGIRRFCELTHTPRRTVEGWQQGRSCPDHVRYLCCKACGLLD